MHNNQWNTAFAQLAIASSFKHIGVNVPHVSELAINNAWFSNETKQFHKNALHALTTFANGQIDKVELNDILKMLEEKHNVKTNMPKIEQIVMARKNTYNDTK